MLRASWYNYDYTSQDHFCNMIDKFPVWNLKPYSAMMMRLMACSEREKVSIFQRIEALMIARRPSSFRLEHVIVWVVFYYGVHLTSPLWTLACNIFFLKICFKKFCRFFYFSNVCFFFENNQILSRDF